MTRKLFAKNGTSKIQPLVVVNEDDFRERSDGEAKALGMRAVDAIGRLVMLRSTVDATHAAHVAMAAIDALMHPSEAHAATVRRMLEALLGADVRGRGFAIHQLAELVDGARNLRRNEPTAADAPKMLLETLRARWPEKAKRVDASALTEWLDHRTYKTSGIVARLMKAMRWEGTTTKSIAVVTKDVNRVLREQRRRSPF